MPRRPKSAKDEPKPRPKTRRAKPIRSRRLQSGLTAIQEAELLERSVKWNRGQRWPTRVPRSLLEAAQVKPEGPTIIEAIAKSVYDLLDQGDPRSIEAAQRTALSLEAANQLDQLKPTTINNVAGDQYNQNNALVAAYRTAADELLNDPNYLEFERDRLFKVHADSGDVCQVCEPGALAAGEASVEIGPGRNGSSHR